MPSLISPNKSQFPLFEIFQSILEVACYFFLFKGLQLQKNPNSIVYYIKVKLGPFSVNLICN
jgi:hypothetical protein